MNHSNTLIRDPVAVSARLTAAQEKIAAAFAGNPNIQAAWLVGSFATGDADHLSDVDILVFSASNMKDTFRLRKKIAGIIGAPTDAVSIWPEEKPKATAAPSLTSARLLFDRKNNARQFEEACFAALGTRPSPEEARLLAIQFRAERLICRAMRRPFFSYLVPACFGLGRAVLRTLNIGPLRSRFDVPRLALEQGFVPHRTAWVVWRAGVLYYSGSWLWKDAYESTVLEFGAGWRFADWAWLMRAAAERATIERACGCDNTDDR